MSFCFSIMNSKLSALICFTLGTPVDNQYLDLVGHWVQIIERKSSSPELFGQDNFLCGSYFDRGAM